MYKYNPSQTFSAASVYPRPNPAGVISSATLVQFIFYARRAILCEAIFAMGRLQHHSSMGAEGCPCFFP
jgi:hypothetical protein